MNYFTSIFIVLTLIHGISNQAMELEEMRADLTQNQWRDLIGTLTFITNSKNENLPIISATNSIIEVEVATDLPDLFHEHQTSMPKLDQNATVATAAKTESNALTSPKSQEKVSEALEKVKAVPLISAPQIQSKALESDNPPIVTARNESCDSFTTAQVLSEFKNTPKKTRKKRVRVKKEQIPGLAEIKSKAKKQRVWSGQITTFVLVPEKNDQRAATNISDSKSVENESQKTEIPQQNQENSALLVPARNLNKKQRNWDFAMQRLKDVKRKNTLKQRNDSEESSNSSSYSVCSEDSE